jgi:pyrroline-5-carboxylate reductase
MRVGIIGTGTLGSAIAHGLRDHGDVRAIDGTTRKTAHRNQEMVRASNVVLLCVKPHDAHTVLGEIAPSLTREHVLISTAAALTIAEIRESAGPHARIVRVMPNTPAQVGVAMTVLARDESTNAAALANADSLFAHLGRTLVMDESKMDAVTAISGCGPAFMFVVIEALVDAAIALGIPYAHAREMVAQTMLGSAQLLLSGDDHPAKLKTDVATPAGKTIKGLVELEKHGVRNALIQAALASALSS